MKSKNKPQCPGRHWGSEETSSAKRCQSSKCNPIVEANASGVKKHGKVDGPGGADE